MGGGRSIQTPLWIPRGHRTDIPPARAAWGAVPDAPRRSPPKASGLSPRLRLRCCSPPRQGGGRSGGSFSKLPREVGRRGPGDPCRVPDGAAVPRRPQGRAPKPPGLRPSSPGIPFRRRPPGPSWTLPPGRPGLVRPPPPPPRPARNSPGPRPLPPTPGAGAGRGGDGDWAAARGRVLGREARRPLSFSAPAPPPPPPSLLAPAAAAAEVGALAGPPRLLPQPGPSPSAAPPPLAAAASLLPPPSRSFPERPAGRERGGCEEA